MNKESTEQIICNWLSSMGYTRACSIKLEDVRRLVTKLVVKDRPSDESGGVCALGLKRKNCECVRADKEAE